MRKSFLYSNGVVASLSNLLITKESFNRLIESKTNLEALSVLQETNFASGVSIETPYQIEELLNFETKKFLKFIKDESPIDELIYFFTLPYDYNNISAFCKSIVLNQNASNFIEAEGCYELAKIKDYVTTKNFDGFNNRFIKLALQEFQVLAGKPNIRGEEIDFTFKKYLYQNLLEVCKSNKVVKQIIEYKLTIENISTAMRATNKYQLEQQIMQGSKLSTETLTKIFQKNKDALYQVSDPILIKFVKFALQDNKEKSFVEYEKLKNTYQFLLLSTFSEDINSVAPFAIYCFKKQLEIKNIRLIFSFHNNNLSEFIKKRFLEINL